MSADCCSLALASMPGKIFFCQFLQYLWCALAMLQMVCISNATNGVHWQCYKWCALAMLQMVCISNATDGVH